MEYGLSHPSHVMHDTCMKKILYKNVIECIVMVQYNDNKLIDISKTIADQREKKLVVKPDVIESRT